MVPPPEARWRAAADGLGHGVLQSRGRQVRTVCGKPLWAERIDSPVVERCNECVAGLDRLAEQALHAPTQVRGTWC